jgi:hypothetical protein
MQRYVGAGVNATVLCRRPDGDELGSLPEDSYTGLYERNARARVSKMCKYEKRVV